MINKELEEFIKDETKAYEKRLRAKVEELQEQMADKSKTIWDLKKEDGKEYYHLDSEGYISVYEFKEIRDEQARDMCNAFLTLEEVVFERNRREIEAIMRKYSRPFETTGENWSIYYSYCHEPIATQVNVYNSGLPYFESEEIARKVIDEIGEDKLKKYWFRVAE